MLLPNLFFSLFFTGDFIKTAEGISTKLSMQMADGLEQKTWGQTSEICRGSG